MTRKTLTLDKYRPDITKHLTNFLSHQKSSLAKISLDDDTFTTLNNFLRRGKMARGNLLILAHTSFQTKISKLFSKEVLLPLASALELIQAALLIHDDIIDQDEQRRGQNSIWQHYALQSQNNNRHYGESQAICLGDLCFFLANQLIAQACANLNSTKKVNKTKVLNIQSLINREINQVIMAEMLDVQLAMKSKLPSLEQILEMNLYKTARYTFSLPLMLAGYLADQPSTSIKHLSNIGEKIGLIFQIQDDYLGIFGNNNKTGKPVLSDVREGKKTIFYFYLMTAKTLTAQEKDLLNNCFGKPNINQEQAKTLQELFKTHSLKQANKLIKKLNQQALDKIKQLNNKDLQKLLKEILQLAQHRQS